MKRSSIIIALFILTALLVSQCAPAATPTPEKVVVTEEVVVTQEVIVTQEVVVTEIIEVPAEQLAIAAAVGDIAAGEELFNQPVDGVPHSWSCSSCHSLDGSDSQDGPTLAGISAVAADRVVGLSDVDYIRQSIVDPYAFRDYGEWRGVMPYQYSELFSDDQINNLIAFLLTR